MAVSATVSLTFDQSRVNAVIGGQTAAAVARAAKITADRASQNVYQSGRVRTGRMARSFQVSMESGDPLKPAARIWSDVDYTIYQERGTRYISPAWFMKRAIDALTPKDFQR